jgi:hypothetical protein
LAENEDLKNFNSSDSEALAAFYEYNNMQRAQDAEEEDSMQPNSDEPES